MVTLAGSEHKETLVKGGALNKLTATERFRRILEEGKCVGCGVCASRFPGKLSMIINSTGYFRPQVKTELDDDTTDDIYGFCPGIVQTGLDEKDIGMDSMKDSVWGNYTGLYQAHAADERTRKVSATGGVLTGLSQYLIDSGTVKFILHVRGDNNFPGTGKNQLSQDNDDLVRAAGSVYGPTAPLSQLHELLEGNEKFAVVAKPCDISAIRLLSRTDQRINELITHCLTMVCGGYSPPSGTLAFLHREGIEAGEVKHFSYRRGGCPGPVEVGLEDGTGIEKSYLEFWGEDESMWHLPWRCKVCPDGTGEGADIAAADSWPGGSPDADTMQADPGTNAVVIRTAKGKKLFEDACAAGFIRVSGDASIEDLNNWQPHQVKKKYAALARYKGMLKAGHLQISTPNLTCDELYHELDETEALRQLEGTMQRIAIGKHRDDYGLDELESEGVKRWPYMYS